MKRNSVFYVLVMLMLEGTAQTNVVVHKDLPAAIEAGPVKVECLGSFTPAPMNTTFMPLLEPIIYPAPKSGSDELDKIKLKNALLRDNAKISATNEENSSSKDASPSYINIGKNFDGNMSNGCPPDNTIAISNNGHILSLVNSNIYHFNENGLLLNQWNIYNFMFNLAPPNNLCDPKIIYDSDADRFIFYVQTCDNSLPSKILLAFSQSNNPGGPWWISSLTGDPLSQNHKFDYPKIALTASELIVTGNLFTSAGAYVTSIVCQINKNTGYAGTLNGYQFYHSLPGSPFTLLPLRNGQGGNYGTGMYFLASDPGGSSVIRLYYLTGPVGTGQQLLPQATIGTDAYSPPGNASQPNTAMKLNTGDCRMMDGFYQNGIAHYAFTVNDQGWGAIRYYRTNLNTYAGSYNLITYPGVKDYSYPAISSFATNPTNQSSYVSFLASGPNTFPEMRGKFFDADFVPEASIQIKSGNGMLNNCYDANKGSARWGDYSGSARKHNSPVPRIWVSGCYGNNFGSWSTYISEIYDPNPVTGLKELQKEPAVKLFPNPASQHVSVEFTSDLVEKLDFDIYNTGGNKMATLSNAYCSIGLNRFSFSTESLAPGVYFLRISSKDQVIKNEKIVISR